VYEELRKVVADIELHELHRFQNLRKKMVEVMNTLLERQLEPANQQVKNLVRIQDAYINTYHPDFMGGSNSIVNVFDAKTWSDEQLNQLNLNEKDNDDSFDAVDEERKGQQQRTQALGVDMLVKKQVKGEGSELLEDGRLKNLNEYEIQKYMQPNIEQIHLPDMPGHMRAKNADPGQSSPRSQLETKIIKSLIVSYFNTVRKSMNDVVPKSIMSFLVNKTKNMAQKELVSALYNENVDLKELLAEDTATVKKRTECEEMVKTLTQSLEFLNEVRDFYFESETF